MNLLRRLGKRCLDRFSFSLISRRPSNGLRPVDPIPTTSPAATNKDTSWVMLNRLVCRMDDNDSAAADGKTVVQSRTRTGLQLRVALGLVPPPASSFLYYDWVNGAPSMDNDKDYCVLNPNVIATHRDSILFEMGNYFVYRVGADTRLPSLSRLPALFVDVYVEVEHHNAWERREINLFEGNTGILRHGKDELLVAWLDAGEEEPDLWVHRLGRTDEWEIKKALPIVLDAGGERDEPVPWLGNTSDKVVAVGDRFLCWVNYYKGVLVCDMVEERPKLRYVPLPVVPPWWKGYYEVGNRPEIEVSRDMCGTGDDTLRFVGIDLRCCCGGFGMSSCEHSRNAFMVTSWSMSLAMKKPLVWVKDTVLHCEELWALPGYEGLPRVHPECPVMSLHNPDVVFLRISEENFVSFEERKVWVVEVDTRGKALLSVVPCTTDAQKNYGHVPAKL
ncbi:unnamed protein product [Urochloa humidicola]